MLWNCEIDIIHFLKKILRNYTKIFLWNVILLFVRQSVQGPKLALWIRFFVFGSFIDK